MRTIIVVLLLAVVASPALAESAATLSVDLNQFVSLVEKGHPEKSIDELARARASEAENKAGVLSDPEIALGREEVPLNAMDPEASSRAMSKLTITQMFPWPGTLSSEKSAAEAATQRQDVSVKLSAAQRRLDAKDFYISLVAASKLIGIERENLAETTNILKSAEARLKYGVGSHHDVIQAQNEKTVLSLNLDAMEGDLQNLKDQAAQMMGRDDASGLTFALTIPSEYISPQSAPASASDDFTKAKLQATQSEASAQLAAERKKSLPSFMASGMLMKEDSGMQMYSFMAGVRIPIFSGSVRQGVAAEQALVSRQTSEELTWHDKRKQLALTQNKRRRSIVEANLRGLSGEIVPNARQHLKTIATEYEQGKGSFAQVNAARKLLLKYQLAQIIAERDLAMTTVSRERIEAGIIDAELNRPMPQLPSTEMSSGEMSSMGSGMGSSQTMPMNPAAKPKPKRQKPSTMPSEEEQGQSKGMNGMGGM